MLTLSILTDIYEKRSSTNAYTREMSVLCIVHASNLVLISPSHVHAFTPSALATILLSAPKDKHHDYATMYAALRRHLSTKIADRYYSEFHGFTQGDGPNVEVWHVRRHCSLPDLSYSFSR